MDSMISSNQEVGEIEEVGGESIDSPEADLNSEYDFDRSGPNDLQNIDWNDRDHKRRVTSGLVQRVYNMESERQQKKLEKKNRFFKYFSRSNRNDCNLHAESQAPRCWESFNFEWVESLVNKKDSIFGAVFRYNNTGDSTNGRPTYVIAFRRTLLKRYSIKSDLAMNISFIKNTLGWRTRFRIAMETVRKFVDKYGASNVWLTGHSLGAAVGMLAGKTLAKEQRIFLQAFLFNPPCLTIPIEFIDDENFQFWVQRASTVFKANLVPSTKKSRNGDLFDAISGWIPHLFVNKNDPICSGYIGYFNHWEMMLKEGAEGIAKFEKQHSLANLVLSMMIKGVQTAEPLHLLPSAELTVNEYPSSSLVEAHELRQWCSPKLILKHNIFNYGQHKAKSPVAKFFSWMKAKCRSLKAKLSHGNDCSEE